MKGLNVSSKWAIAGVATLAVAALWGCGSNAPGNTGGVEGSNLSGEVKIDGSGTVYPVQAALAELFRDEQPGVKVSVGQAGTGAGMQKFIAGETDISNASRPIKSSEIEALQKAGIEFIELPIAYDGLSIIVNKENTWLKQITIEQLNKLWNVGSKVTKWSEIDPSFPNEKIELYGPTSAHGTYEYFNEAVNGDSKNTRQDYQQCAEYNPLVAGVQNSKYALGYVGYAYYVQSKDKVRVVPVVNKSGTAVAPSDTTIQDGSYNPLSRPLMVYVRADSASRSEVVAYVNYLLGAGNKLAVEAAGYIVLPSDILAQVQKRFDDKVSGSVLTTLEPGASLVDALKAAN